MCLSPYLGIGCRAGGVSQGISTQPAYQDSTPLWGRPNSVVMKDALHSAELHVHTSLRETPPPPTHKSLHKCAYHMSQIALLNILKSLAISSAP